MDGINVLITFVCGFVVAQLIKFVIGATRGESRKQMKTFSDAVAYLTRSGGMPSGHAASFVGATTYLGLSQGFGSAIFALAACMTIIVIYDAINVRYAVGEQGKTLISLIENYHPKGKKTRVVEGHTVPQVIVGSLIGVVVALIIFALA